MDPRGFTSRMMTDNFESIDPRLFLRHARTYPRLIPFLHLDHFYFDKLHFERFQAAP